MDLGSAFSFAFDDEEWLKKVLIGGVVMFIPFGQFLAIGYAMEVARRVVSGHPQLLPEWDDWVGKLVDGLMTVVIGFVWALPMIVLGSCIWVIMVPIAGVDESGETASLVFLILSICVGLFALLYGLLLALVLPAALTHYAVRREFGAAFRFGEVIGLVRDNVGSYLMVFVVTIIAGFIGALGSIGLGCGALFTSFYAQLVTYYAYGQAYRTAVGNVESQVSLAY